MIVCLGAVRGDIHTLHGVCLPVVHERAKVKSCIPRDEVGRPRLEGHVTAIRADGRIVTEEVCLRAI